MMNYIKEGTTQVVSHHHAGGLVGGAGLALGMKPQIHSTNELYVTKIGIHKDTSNNSGQSNFHQGNLSV